VNKKNVTLKIHTPILGLRKRHGVQDKKAAATQQPTPAWRLRAQSRPSTQIAKGFVGKAFVSIHFRPVSTPSLCSVGHSPKVHGTQAQYKLATSPCLNVRCNTTRKGKIQKDKERQPARKQDAAIVAAKTINLKTI